MATAGASWAKAVTNCTQFSVQNTGPGLLLVYAVATTGAAPTALEGFQVGIGQLLPLSGLAGHDVYLKGANGSTDYELLHDGS